jgi:hypothetical protein
VASECWLEAVVVEGVLICDLLAAGQLAPPGGYEHSLTPWPSYSQAFDSCAEPLSYPLRIGRTGGGIED